MNNLSEPLALLPPFQTCQHWSINLCKNCMNILRLPDDSPWFDKRVETAVFG